MDYQSNRTRADSSYRYPAFFVFGRRVGLRDGKRVVEDQGSAFEAHIVFSKIETILALIPSKSHR